MVVDVTVAALVVVMVVVVTVVGQMVCWYTYSLRLICF